MTKNIEYIDGLGEIVRYTEVEQKTGRWVHRGTVERVYWRAVPFNLAVPITYHRRRKDALAALEEAKP